MESGTAVSEHRDSSEGAVSVVSNVNPSSATAPLAGRSPEIIAEMNKSLPRYPAEVTSYDGDFL